MTATHPTPEQLFSENQGLAYYFSKSFWAGGYGDDDLKQIALIGLWKAAQGFDASKGFKFSTYAGLIIKHDLISIVNKGKRRPELLAICEDLLVKLAGKTTDYSPNRDMEELKMALAENEQKLLDYLIDEYSCTELGKIYGMSKQGMHKRIKALRERLTILINE